MKEESEVSIENKSETKSMENDGEDKSVESISENKSNSENKSVDDNSEDSRERRRSFFRNRKNRRNSLNNLWDSEHSEKDEKEKEKEKYETESAVESDTGNIDNTNNNKIEFQRSLSLSNLRNSFKFPQKLPKKSEKVVGDSLLFATTVINGKMKLRAESSDHRLAWTTWLESAIRTN